MPDPNLDRLFRIQGFVADLVSVADLSADTWGRVREVLAADRGPVSAEVFTSEDVQLVAEATDLSPARARAALRVYGTLAHYLGTVESTPDALAARIRAELEQRDASGEILAGQVPLLSEAVEPVRQRQARAQLIAEAGRTVSEISVTTDLRLRVDDDGPRSTRDLEQYSPRIKELVPVVIIRVSFASADDGDDVVFQLSPTELDTFVLELQGVRKRIDSAMKVVRLNDPRGASS